MGLLVGPFRFGLGTWDKKPLGVDQFQPGERLSLRLRAFVADRKTPQWGLFLLSLRGANPRRLDNAIPLPGEIRWKRARSARANQGGNLVPSNWQSGSGSGPSNKNQGTAARMKRRIALVALSAIALLFVSGCQTAPKPGKPAPEVVTAPPEPQPVKPVVPEGPAPGSPAARTQSQQQLRLAAESLNEGNEDKARGEIAEALRLDPESKLGQCLNRGLTVDPEQALGKQYTKYTVRPSETLGRISQRALGESCEFYLLARYNGIRVPKQLAGGQVIRIPGRVPLAPPDAAAKPSTESAPAATTEAVPPPPPPAVPAPSDAAAKAALSQQELRAQIDRHHRDAQAAFRRQDLATAIREWDMVLALDPTNDLARARRQEAIELERRIKQVK